VGLKCDRCQDGQLVDKTPGGCRGSSSATGGSNPGGSGTNSEEAMENESRHCSDLTCRFGAICQDLQGQAVCVCPMDCPVANSAEQTVCGSDGVSYGSECDLRLAACRKQLNVALVYEGPCSDEMIHSPAAKLSSDLAVSKATRHVHQNVDEALPDWSRRDIVSLSQVGSQQVNNQYYGFSEPVWRPTAATIQVQHDGSLGDPCTEDAHCQLITNSGCLLGICSCMDGFVEGSDRRSCTSNLNSLILVLALI